MADINQVITLGIGTPSGVPHFLLVGLSPTGPVDVVVSTTAVDAVALLATAVDAVSVGATSVDAVALG